MKQSIFEAARQPEKSAQSFIMRVWQEKPGHLRGTIQHVQSDSRRGFEQLAQAQQFVESHLPTIDSKPFERSMQDRVSLPGFRLAFGIVAALLFVAVVSMWGNSTSVADAAATSTLVPSLSTILVFLSGTALGGIAVGIVLRIMK